MKFTFESHLPGSGLSSMSMSTDFPFHKMATVSDLAKDVWLVVLEQFRNARDGNMVMDDPSAELFHWTGVQDLLKFPQRLEIWRFLDSSSRGLKSALKADALVVFVLCRVIGEEELDRITSLLSFPRDTPIDCSIFTAYSDEVQSKCDLVQINFMLLVVCSFVRIDPSISS